MNNLNESTVMSGVICNNCKTTIPDHTIGQHMDKEFMSNLHTCKKLFEVPNYRNINAYYVAPTNTRDSRICIEEKKRVSSSKVARKYFSFDYQFGDVQKQAFRILQKAGFKIMARSADNDKYIFLVDNWGDNYIKISDLKNRKALPK